MPCGTCHYCVKGKEDLCETFFKFNRLQGTLYDGKTRLFRPNGTPIAMYSMAGLAEYSVVPSTAVFGLPEGVPYVESSILGCAIFTAYGAMKNAADMRAGETVAIVGTGGVGANCLQIARAFGGDKIIAIDISDDKLKAMKPLGATHLINASKENVVDRIKEITGGRGVDIAVEALGRPETFRQTVDAVVDGGRAVMVGIAPAGVLAPVEITRLVRRQIKIIGSYGARARTDLPAILRLVQRGFIDVSSPITARYSLADSAQAYKDLNAHKITGRAIIDMQM
jgi:Zn-dependent alcohol dehydrogenase